MLRKILYLINPVSGTGNKEKLYELIAHHSRKAAIAFEIENTRPNGDYSFLRNKIIEKGITDVVIAGGDGTVNQVVSYLQGLDVNTGIIPMGSGNGLAYAVGIPKNPAKALQVIFKGKSESCDGFLVKNKFGCMLTGLGFDAQVAADFLHKKKRGLFTYIRLCFINYFKAPTYTISLQFGGQLITREILFISIANSNQFGNHVTIAPRASLNDGLLDVVIVTKKNKITTAFSLLWQIARGKIKAYDQLEKNAEATVLYFQTHELYIDNPQLAPLHVDGEPIETAGSLFIRVIPRAFRLIQP